METSEAKRTGTDSGIYLVDDEREFTELMGSLLEEGLGAKINVFNDPVLAFEAMQAGDPKFLITDLAMPRLTGFELLRKVAQQWPHVPCVLITGNQLDSATLDAHRTPSLIGVLFKPLSWRAIAACVREHVGLN